MRFTLATIVAATASLAACSVPSKQAPDSDGGLDAGTSDGGEDTSAPETTITASPDEFSREGSATFRFESDDASAMFECSFDTETPVACSSPYTRALGDGTHSFSVRAIDGAGNGDDTPAEYLWSIDRVAPDTILIEKPPAADNSVMVQFTFDSAEQNVSFECSLDGSSFAVCESGTALGPIGDGVHTFQVRAHDRAGNIDASPATYGWTVDTSTPDTQLLTGPEGFTDSTVASFSFVSPDAGSGATFQCALDGAAFTACSSPQSFSNLAEREHTFAVRVRDSVGNFDPTPATRTWTVDLTAPNTTITSGPSGTVDIASATFTFTASEADATFECSVDGGGFAACTSPFNLAALAQGGHSFAVRAKDTANHTDATPATRTWTVDTIAPDIAIVSGPATGSTSGPRVSFGFTVSEGTAVCSLDTAPFTACTSPISFSLPAGPHQLRVRATDGAGNVTTVSRSWTVACAAPDAAGAAGLLHLDAAGQLLANAVVGGAEATLGSDATVELGDPEPVAAGRFGGALAFTAAEGDHVAWPIALGATPALTIEVWSRPAAVGAGARELVASGDGLMSLRVAAASPTTVRYSIVIDGNAVSSGVVAAGDWHHVIASLDQPNLRLWVDGVRTDVAIAPLAAPPTLGSLRLGGTAATAYSGALDEVWLAQTAIATDEAALARYCPL